jgi:hypothetical protein
MGFEMWTFKPKSQSEQCTAVAMGRYGKIEHQTTNLGVRSSNLFGRANKSTT